MTDHQHEQHEHDDPKRTAELEQELRELLVAERDALRAMGVRASIVGGGVVAGRAQHRRLWRLDRSDSRRLRRAERAAAPRAGSAAGVFVDAIQALGGLEALDDRGRAHYAAARDMAVSRAPSAPVLSAEEVAKRADRKRMDDERKAALAYRRDQARRAGGRRLSRYDAAAREVLLGDPETRSPLARRLFAARVAS